MPLRRLLWLYNYYHRVDALETATASAFFSCRWTLGLLDINKEGKREHRMNSCHHFIYTDGRQLAPVFFFNVFQDGELIMSTSWLFIRASCLPFSWFQLSVHLGDLDLYIVLFWWCWDCFSTEYSSSFLECIKRLAAHELGHSWINHLTSPCSTPLQLTTLMM